MALWLQNFVNTELKEEEQNIPKRIKSSSSVFMPSVTYCLLFRDLQISVHGHPEFLGAHPYPHCVLIF